MQYVKINIIAPDGVEYCGKVNTDASAGEIIEDMAEALNINKDDLVITLIGGIKLENNSTIKLFYKKAVKKSAEEIDFEED